jgi:hypothetical protein
LLKFPPEVQYLSWCFEYFTKMPPPRWSAACPECLLGSIEELGEVTSSVGAGVVSSNKDKCIAMPALLNKTQDGRKPTDYSAFLRISYRYRKMAVFECKFPSIKNTHSESCTNWVLHEGIPYPRKYFAISSFSVPYITDGEFVLFMSKITKIHPLVSTTKMIVEMVKVFTWAFFR